MPLEFVGRAKARSAVPTLLFCEYLTMPRYRLAKIEGQPGSLHSRRSRKQGAQRFLFFRAGFASVSPPYNYKLQT
jgi:hypothetical protein